MAYDAPIREVFSFSNVNFGANGTRLIKGRVGRKTKIIGVRGNVTTAFAGATTPGRMQVGDAAGVTPNLYADVPFGAAGAGTPAGQVANGDMYSTGLVQLVPGKHIYPPTGADVLLTLLAPTGAGAAGVADVHVTVDYC